MKSRRIDESPATPDPPRVSAFPSDCLKSGLQRRQQRPLPGIHHSHHLTVGFGSSPPRLPIMTQCASSNRDARCRNARRTLVFGWPAAGRSTIGFAAADQRRDGTRTGRAHPRSSGLIAHLDLSRRGPHSTGSPGTSRAGSRCDWLSPLTHSDRSGRHPEGLAETCGTGRRLGTSRRKGRQKRGSTSASIGVLQVDRVHKSSTRGGGGRTKNGSWTIHSLPCQGKLPPECRETLERRQLVRRLQRRYISPRHSAGRLRSRTGRCQFLQDAGLGISAFARSLVGSWGTVLRPYSPMKLSPSQCRTAARSIISLSPHPPPSAIRRTAFPRGAYLPGDRQLASADLDILAEARFVRRRIPTPAIGQGMDYARGKRSTRLGGQMAAWAGKSADLVSPIATWPAARLDDGEDGGTQDVFRVGGEPNQANLWPPHVGWGRRKRRPASRPGRPGR